MLVVYAHQSSGSFNAAAKDAAVEVLCAQGCTVDVSDLYALKFKATATAEDIVGEIINMIAWLKSRMFLWVSRIVLTLSALQER